MSSAINSDRGAVREEYGGAAKFFHWTIAVAVLTMIPVGIAMIRIEPGTTQNVLFTVHRSLGILVLALMILRLGNRLIVGWPAPEPTITPFQRIASHAVHNLLYLLLFVQPLLGWYATSAFPATISFFGLFDVPSIASPNEALAKQLFVVHMGLGLVITALLALHIGAALYHHFVRRDGVLQRMLP